MFSDEQLRDLTERLQDEGRIFVVVPGYSIGTTATPVAHGLGFVPRASWLVPRSPVAWSQPQPSDEKHVYFQAASALVADVVVLV